MSLDYECCKFQGSAVGVAAKTGRQVWKSFAFQERPYFLGKKNSQGRDLFGPAGLGQIETIALMDGEAAAQIRQRERLLSVAAVGRADQIE